MGFLKEVFSFVGEVAGEVVGGTVNKIGDVTGSEFIGEIGDGIKKASSFAGDKLGEAASGTWDIAAGIITQDEAQLDVGLNDMGKAIGDTARAAGHTICNVVENGTDVVGGLIDGDNERLKEGAKGVLKVGVVGALSFGIIDLVDGADAVDGNSTAIAMDGANGQTALAYDHSPSVTSDPEIPASDSDVTLVDNPNNHHVEPHWRTLSDGTKIWVDGDGDTSVNTFEGWNQSSPDYRVEG
ncbi:hypothetical protein [Sporosarcina beigongshangi]|uniref:hypothetical protein n=1 Tax=Sporosarcina beigongshangi TaxID=2782538 RepID=UPI001939F631|nr:hypothetical protein [Sporosarcina beigongshangi]